MAFDSRLDEQELLQETKEESGWLLMDPLDRFINKETQADTAQENACASYMKIQQKYFEHTARQNSNLPGINNTDGGSEITLPTTKTAQMMIGWTIMAFTVARIMMMMAILLTTHQTGWMKMMRMVMRFWGTAWMASH
jgi:hypothetical protein